MRKGQFYLLDAFMAATILFVGFGLLFMNYADAPDKAQAQRISQDLTVLLYDSRIGDLNIKYINDNYAILDEERSPIQQAHYWVWNTTQGCAWCLDENRAFIGNLTADLVPHPFGAELIINETSVWNKSSGLKDINFLLVNKQVVVTAANETEVIGPIVVEVRVWG